MKKNTKITFSRSFSILAAAALSMTLIGGQTFPAVSIVEPTIVILLSLLVGLVLLSVMMPLLGILSDFAM